MKPRAVKRELATRALRALRAAAPSAAMVGAAALEDAVADDLLALILVVMAATSCTAT